MSTQTLGDTRIGPELRLETFRLPAHVGEYIAAMFGTEERIETVEDWITAVNETGEERQNTPVTEADLCTSADGPHEVEIAGETHSYVCVIDPLLVPFLRGMAGTVRSTTPEDGGGVTVEIGPDGATATPADAVISIGVSHDVDDDGDMTPERSYEQVCPYVHAFGSVDEYERWDASVDAATTSVSVETGVALAREIGRELFDDETGKN